jgi:CNT family concentrative nucleoside transporter
MIAQIGITSGLILIIFGILFLYLNIKKKINYKFIIAISSIVIGTIVLTFFNKEIITLFLYFKDKFQGLIGIVLILAIAYLFSNNKKRINYRLVFSGLGLQLVIGILVLKIPAVTSFFQTLGKAMGKIEQFSRQGAAFVYGGVGAMSPSGVTDFTNGGFVFAFNVTATIILVCVLVALLYHFGIMQRIVAVIAKAMNFIMRVSGAEALSNVASAFVGQVEAQVMIRPYLPTMTKSEILASMSGSLACIAGGILIVYANMGAQAGIDLAPKLITASLMAAPGALVIAKILFPETQESQTMGKVKLEVKSQYSNTIDAITHGAGEGFKIAMNVIAMLIGFIALIAFIDWSLLKIGHLFNANLNLSLNLIFSKIFYPMAWAMGIPNADIQNAATLLGQKLTINEFVAFKSLTSKAVPIVTEKGLFIVSIAICGFANFSSVGMLIGGIGELVPSRRKDLAELGLKALLAGTLASYLSASIAGILIG